jgi:hypothetical protein
MSLLFPGRPLLTHIFLVMRRHNGLTELVLLVEPPLVLYEPILEIDSEWGLMLGRSIYGRKLGYNSDVNFRQPLQTQIE